MTEPHDIVAVQYCTMHRRYLAARVTCRSIRAGPVPVLSEDLELFLAANKS